MVAQRRPGPIDPCQGRCGARAGAGMLFIRPVPTLT